MSEHTLDDLAARLAALGWNVDINGWNTFEAEKSIDVPTDGVEDYFITLFNDGKLTLTGMHFNAPLVPEVFKALDTIRQWQASAEPAPPPAAPVVTITRAMIDAGANALAGSHMGSNFTDDEIAEIATEAAKACLEAALRGADLAPEGARDGQ